MLFDSFFQDLCLGFRTVVKERSYSALAVGVLALGICGVTTQFSLVQAIALRGFPAPDADRLVGGGFVDPSQPNLFGGAGLPFLQDYEDIAAGARSFAATAAFFSQSTINATVAGVPRRYTGAYVTHDFFRVLAVAPALGRDFTAADHAPGAPRTAILSHEVWQRDFGGKASVLGTAFRLNGRPAVIIGVMPPRFKFPVNEALWVPLHDQFPVTPRDDPRARGSAFMARLKPGVSLDQATAELDAFAKRIAADHPRTSARFTAALLQPLSVNLVGNQLRRLMFAMLGAVFAVLLIACVNVMNMQFARAALRAKELALRGALGATRLRLARQLLTESLVLAALGAVLGVLLAHWAIDAIADAAAGLSFPLPAWIEFTVDPAVLAFTVGTTVLAALGSGLVPALLSTRAAAAAVLKDSARGNTGRIVNRVTSALVVAQIALTATLLILSTLQIKAVVKRTALDYGYDQDAFLSARLALFENDYPTPQARQQFYTRVLHALRARPEVAAAAFSSRLQMLFDNTGPQRYELEGTAYATDADRPRGNAEGITDGYFEVLGLPVLAGRALTPADFEPGRPPVALVNAAFARRHFGRDDPLGRRLRPHTPATPQPWRTIVGIVPDTLMQGPLNTQVDSAGWFAPIHEPQPPLFSTVIVRPAPGHSPAALAAVLRAELAKIDPNLPLYFVGPPRQWHDAALGRNRILASVFGMFGFVAVLLSAVGLYGVMSFAVNRRTQEIGIRMALGADARNIVRMVLRQGALQLALGLALGVVAALVLVRLGGAALSNLLFRENLADPVIYAGVCLLLAVVAAASCLVPARRATRVDPMVALRTE